MVEPKKQENIHRGNVQSEEQVDTTDAWSLYMYAMKSPVTRQKYVGRLDKFFDFIGLEGTTTKEKGTFFIRRASVDGSQWVFSNILRFMQFQLERVQKREITGSTVNNYLKSIKLFCEMADISITWKKISRGLPRGKNYADDRIPTDKEIEGLLKYPDRRLRAIVSTMASSGIRLGAWDYLKWGHVRPIEKDGKIIAAKIIVYGGEEDEYFSFLSQEAYLLLSDWMNYRRISGETVSEESWLMRDLWDTGGVQGGKGLVTMPVKLAPSGIKRLIERAIWAQGLRKRLENGKKRHPFQAVHCFRKWFKTKCEIGGMRPINVETLLNHRTGISSSYYRPTETDLLEDFLKVQEMLTFDKREILHDKLMKSQLKSQDELMIFKGKLQAREEEIGKINRRHEESIQQLKEEMEVKFQQLLMRIDTNKI